MNDEVNSHSAEHPGETVYVPAKIIQRLFILLPPPKKAEFSTKRLMLFQWRNSSGDEVKPKQNANYYRRLEVGKREAGSKAWPFYRPAQ